MKVDHHRLGVQVSVAGAPFAPLADEMATAVLASWPAEHPARRTLEQGGGWRC